MIFTVKQKMLLESFTKTFSKIHKKTNKITESYCKDIVKQTVSEIYKIYPDKNVGKISINWYDSNFNKTPSIDENTKCFELNFHDIYSGIPWLVCRFYDGVSKCCMYLRQ